MANFALIGGSGLDQLSLLEGKVIEKIVLLITVIVRVEHTEKQALSKTTGTDEEEIAASPALAKKIVLST